VSQSRRYRQSWYSEAMLRVLCQQSSTLHLATGITAIIFEPAASHLNWK
jgi:hypothetical protein